MLCLMPHRRKRILENLIRLSMKHSPIVGIIGQRQTGKTTLLEDIVAVEEYVSLDKAVHLASARNGPESFLDRGMRVLGIDECQLAPELFPALKERVRESKRPGQYLLTGSIRFTSRKLIRESLTGRIVTHELLPLCFSELHETEMTNAVELIRKTDREMGSAMKTKSRILSHGKIQEFLKKGGLPGICFFREEAVRLERFNAHIDTLLHRDIRLVFETTLPTDKLWKALRFFAKNQGKVFSVSEMSRACRISAPALERLIPSFEAIFLIRRVGALGDRRKDRFYLEDQGMATFLNPEVDPSFDLLRFTFVHLLAQLKYLYVGHGSIQCFETRSGAVVPIVLDVNGEKTGFIPLDSESPDAKAIGAAQSFLRHFPKSTVAILTQGKEILSIAKNIKVIPYAFVV